MRKRGFAQVGIALTLAFACAASCRTARSEAPPRPPGTVGQEIVVCGERFAIGTPVVLWFEPPGYDAYATHPHFGDEGPVGLRYQPGRKTEDEALRERILDDDLAALREQVDLFVLHYDACGTSERCFYVLQDLRRLSVHFLLDVDGTLYQTLDLKEQAWHARQANPRSIGIEIANVGAYPEGEAGVLDDWYERTESGSTLTIPERWEAGVRTAGFNGRPRRPERVRGTVQGQELVQMDLTPEQYESLAKLAAGLARIFPGLPLEVPRTEDGEVVMEVLSDEELEEHSGVLAHWHVSVDKVDPGPAFDWEAFLAEARAYLSELP